MPVKVAAISESVDTLRLIFKNQIMTHVANKGRHTWCAFEKNKAVMNIAQAPQTEILRSG